MNGITTRGWVTPEGDVFLRDGPYFWLAEYLAAHPNTELIVTLTEYSQQSQPDWVGARSRELEGRLIQPPRVQVKVERVPALQTGERRDVRPAD